MTTSAATYTIFYKDFDGTPIDIIRDFISLEYTLTENDFGSLYLDLPPTYPIDYFKMDRRLEVSRSLTYGGGGSIEGEKPFFIQLVRKKYDEDGKEYIHILAYDTIHLLSRRIVAYPNNTAYAVKNNTADRILVELFRENYGDLSVDLEGLPEILTRRKFPPHSQLYEAASGNAPTINTDDMSRQLVLPRMQEICAMSSEAGTYLSFDYVRVGNKNLMFKTYIKCRGVDHGSGSINQIKFSVESQNLSYSTTEIDHTEVKNFVYAGGRGQDDNRVVETEADYAGIELSPYNRREDWLDVDTEDIQKAANEAAAIVRSHMPKMIFNGHVSQTPECLYGLHYGWGDIVTAIQDEISVDIHLSTVNVKVSNDGNEEVKIFARNYSEGQY